MVVKVGKESRGEDRSILLNLDFPFISSKVRLPHEHIRNAWRQTSACFAAENLFTLFREYHELKQKIQVLWAEGLGIRLTKLQNRTENRKRTWVRKRKMVTWNTQGITNKMTEIEYLLYHQKADVVIATKIKRKGRGIEEIKDYLYVRLGVDKSQRTAVTVAILLNK